jgi:outer membrane protein assembly factor BamB
VRSPRKLGAAAHRLFALAVCVAAIAAAGCDLSDARLAWSVRRGQVGEFAIRGEEVFTIGARLSVYEAATGRRRRSTPLPADLGDITRGQLGPGALAAGDAVVFGWYDFADETGTVFCFDAASLTLRWTWRIHWPWHQRTLRPTVAVAADDDRVYAATIGNTAENLFAFRRTDGRLLWSRAVESFPDESALGLAGDRLIVRSQLWAWTRDRHEQLDAIGLTDGRRLWRTWLMGDAKHHTGEPLIADGRLYTTTRVDDGGGHLYIVRLSDGSTQRERIETAGAPFAKRGDAIYLGGTPAIAWDARARRTLWTARDDASTPSTRIAGGAIDDGRRRLFTGDPHQFVYVHALDTGLLLQRVRLDRYPRFELSRPVKALYGSYGTRRLHVEGGMLFVGTADSSLFVYRLDALEASSRHPVAEVERVGLRIARPRRARRRRVAGHRRQRAQIRDDGEAILVRPVGEDVPGHRLPVERAAVAADAAADDAAQHGNGGRGEAVAMRREVARHDAAEESPARLRPPRKPL